MSNKIFILAAAAAAVFTSCSSSDDGSVDWGRTESYSDFLWCNYEPVRMERTLVMDFNADAQQLIKEPLRFELRNELTGTKPSTESVKLYKNGTLCPDGVVEVATSDAEVVLGIELNRDVDEGNYKYSLVLTNADVLDRLGNAEVHGSQRLDALQIVCKKSDVMNPLAKGLMWTGIVLVALLLVWMLCLRSIFYPTFKARNFYIKPKGTKEDGHIRIRNYRAVVFASSVKKRQSALSKFFTNEIKYKISPEWDEPWELTPASKKKAVRLNVKGKYDATPKTLNVDAKGTLYNPRNKTTYETTLSL